MITESMAVVAFIVIFSFFSVRTGRRGIAVAALPIAIVPLLYLLGTASAAKLAAMLPGQPIQWLILLVLVGAVLSSVLVGLFASAIRNRKPRGWYLILCDGFVLIFSFTILNYIISNL